MRLRRDVIIKAMVGLRDAAQILEKTVELNQKILTVQTALADEQAEQTSLIQAIREREEETTHLKAWETEKQRYELKELRSGAFAYSLKEEAASGEPPHSICASCYERGQKSILQQETRFPGRASVAVCHGCGAEIYVMGGWETAHTHASRRTKS
jgi:hypothetical protein